MLLYICLECGAWLDMSLGQAVIKGWNSLTKHQPNSQIKQFTPVCPEGHGSMRRVAIEDRLMLRADQERKPDQTAQGKIVTFRRRGVELTFVPLTTEELRKLMEERGQDGSA